MEKRSREWLEGAIAALENLSLLEGFQVGWSENTRKACQKRVDDHLDVYRKGLAALPAPAPSCELVEFALERAMTFMRDSEFRAAETAIISALAAIARAKEQGR